MTEAAQLPGCLIVTAAAAEFRDAVQSMSGEAIPLECCVSADAARAAWDGESILFGNPAMIGEVLSDMPAVDWVQSTWAGVTPLIAHARRDYQLTGVKDVFGPQMSEYVFGYLLGHALKVAERAAAQRERQWYTGYSSVLEGRHLGIMGTGSIGAHIAGTGQCFGMTVSGLSRSGSAVDGFDRVLPVERLEEFLGDCDYLVSTLPQTATTDRLLDAAALGRLPPHAFFVNVGRSNVVDDDALMAALDSGTLAGAALDVFDVEPVPADSPLWSTKNLAITAHIAAVSHPDLIVPIFLDNYARYRAGEVLRYVVDFDAGY